LDEEAALNPGEIWRIPLAGGTFAHARVVLRVSDLAVAVGSPLGFVSDAALVQIAIAKGAGVPGFEPGTLFVDGALVVSHKRLAGTGLEKIGESRAQVDEVEFPLWFRVVGVGEVHLCHGESYYPINGIDSTYVHQKRRIMLSRVLPIQLASYCTNQLNYAESDTVEPPMQSFASCNIRAHKLHLEMLREIGFVQPPGHYADEIKKRGWSDRYERAVNA
jgi:hypothetical protein